MCVLVIGWRQRDDIPLVLAANRDESYERAAVGPEVFRAGEGVALAPRDLQAGGTWIGISSAGLVVAITNRRDGDFDASRPSRGGLTREAFGQSDASAVRSWLEGEVRRQRYNSFNLFYADRNSAFVSGWTGKLVTTSLAPGLHVLSNDHTLGELELPGAAALPWNGSVEDLRSALRRYLGRHTPEPPQGLVVCKHGKRHGTVSSTLVELLSRSAEAEPGAAGLEQMPGRLEHIPGRLEQIPGRLEHAAGPPCRTAFEMNFLTRAGITS